MRDRHPEAKPRKVGGFELLPNLVDGLMNQACPYRKLDPHILVMQSAEDRATDYAANGRDDARNRRILIQRQVRARLVVVSEV